MLVHIKKLYMVFIKQVIKNVNIFYKYYIVYLLYEDELVKHDLRRPLDSNTVLMKIKYG